MKIELSELEKRIKQAKHGMSKCDICPRNCGINRTTGETGFCNSTDKLEVSHIGLHLGEEPFISGTKGSGAIFFTHCNLRCQYCQNWQISQPEKSSLRREFTPENLALEMLNLEKIGAHNINLVSPTHYIPQILETLYYAFKKGLTIPIVYNTNGFDSVKYLELLDGVVDIYLPDIKYSSNKNAKSYSKVKNYVENNRLAIQEMYRQVGKLQTDKNDIAYKGINIRHLVLPNNITGSLDCLDFLLTVSRTLNISLMSQYNPCYKALRNNMLNRPINKKEYDDVVEYALGLGFENLLVQDMQSKNELNPDFEKELPFE